jgi:CRP-like cAMP-binding protein
MRIPCSACPLRDLPAFRRRSEDQVAFINGMKRDQWVYPAGAEIIHLGQDDAELFTLFSGWAFRFKSLPDGRRQILNFLLPGDFIGLQASMFGASLSGVEALTAVQLCVFSRRQVWALFERMPDIAYEVTWLGSREQSIVDENLLSVGLRNAAERVAALIIGLYKRCRTLGLVDGDQSFEFPLSQQHIADALGLSLVHTNKTLARLRRLGLYSLRSGRLKLENPRVLARLAQHFDNDLAQRPLI